MDIGEFVALSVKHNASDLHLCTGHRPMLRIDGELQPLAGAEKLTEPKMHRLCNALLQPQQRQQLQQQGQLDLALTLAGDIRLRANFFLQSLGVSLALRLIAGECPTLAALATPDIIPALVRREDGLILVTGATGSGKSTTLAAMIDDINQHQRRHILTLEDPIEFIHRSRHSLIQQRELGRDSHSFDDALRAALREDPDVILLGSCVTPQPSGWRLPLRKPAIWYWRRCIPVARRRRSIGWWMFSRRKKSPTCVHSWPVACRR